MHIRYTLLLTLLIQSILLFRLTGQESFSLFKYSYNDPANQYITATEKTLPNIQSRCILTQTPSTVNNFKPKTSFNNQ
jgi:hypothetical protein